VGIVIRKPRSNIVQKFVIHDVGYVESIKMIYCNTCANVYGFTQTLFKVEGKCCYCGREGDCNSK